MKRADVRGENAGCVGWKVRMCMILAEMMRTESIKNETVEHLNSNDIHEYRRTLKSLVLEYHELVNIKQTVD